jgi:hypothetical protein
VNAESYLFCYGYLRRVVKGCIATVAEARAIYCGISMNERCLSETDTEQESSKGSLSRQDAERSMNDS